MVGHHQKEIDMQQKQLRSRGLLVLAAAVLVAGTAPAQPATTAALSASAEPMVSGRVALSGLIALTESQLAARVGSLEALALTDEAKSTEWKRIGPLLEGLSWIQDSSAVAWFLLPDGSYYASGKGLAAGKLNDRPYFPEVMAGRTSVGTLVVSKSTGRDVVVVAVPVKSATGTVVGAFGASIYLDTMSEWLAGALMLPPGLVFYALDPQGTTALHARTEHVFDDAANQGSPTLTQAVQTILAEEQGLVTYDFEGTRRQVMFAASPLTGWKFALGTILGQPPAPEK
jgi:hypothetical protein